MATPTTLYEFYTQQGKTLPPLTERSKIYEQYGLGSAGTYTGTAPQNTILLQKLLSGSLVQPITQPQLTPEQTQSFQQQITGFQQQVQALQPKVSAAEQIQSLDPLPIGTPQAVVNPRLYGSNYTANFGANQQSFTTQADAQRAVDRYNARIQQPPPQVQPLGAITGDVLGQTQVPSFISPLGAPPPVSFELGEAEQGFQKELAELRELIKSSTGEAAFRAGQETVARIPEFTQTLNDLANQLNALKAEQMAIAPQLEEQAAGKGITTTILGRQEQGLLRQNAIKSLGVASLLQAAQGNVATAQNLVDRAVRAKFDPIKEEIDTRLTNLNLLLKDPELTLEQERRAQAQKNLQTERRTQADLQESITLANYKLAVSAINNAQKARSSIDALTLQGIQNATSQEEGLRLYNQAISGLPVIQPSGVIKPPTAAQQTVAGYAARIEQANPLIKNLENTISGMNVINFELQSRLPSALQSANFRQFDQAARNFINSVLRRESGAAISSSEFDNARKQYLPVAGDDETTLRQKEVNRRIVFENLKQSAGGAFSSVEELLSGETSVGGAESEVYITPDGTEYVKGEDGLYYPR